MKTREIMNNVLLIVFCTLVTICLIAAYVYCQYHNITTGWYNGVYFTLKSIDWETTGRVMVWCVLAPAVLGVFVFGNICCYLGVIEDIRRIKKYYTK